MEVEFSNCEGSPTVEAICHTIQANFDDESAVIVLPSGNSVIVHAHFVGSTPPFDEIEAVGIGWLDIYALCIAPLGLRGTVYHHWYVDPVVWAELDEDAQLTYRQLPSNLASIIMDQIVV